MSDMLPTYSWHDQLIGVGVTRFPGWHHAPDRHPTLIEPARTRAQARRYEALRLRKQDMTYMEIAAALGVSRQRVNQYLADVQVQSERTYDQSIRMYEARRARWVEAAVAVRRYERAPADWPVPPIVAEERDRLRRVMAEHREWINRKVQQRSRDERVGLQDDR